MSHTLIPNPDPTLRILLHRTDDQTYVTVETDETDAIGAHQWRKVEDSRHEKVRASAVLALIDYAKPSALSMAATSPVALGTCEGFGPRARCSLVNQGVLRLVTEDESRDQAGAPRWDQRGRTDCLTTIEGNPVIGLVYADLLIACLFPR